MLNYRNFCTNEDFYRKIFQCVKSIRSSFERILSDELSGQRLYYVLDLFLPKSDLFQILTGSPHAFHRMRHVDLAQIGGDERALGRHAHEGFEALKRQRFVGGMAVPGPQKWPR